MVKQLQFKKSIFNTQRSIINEYFICKVKRIPNKHPYLYVSVI